MSDQALFDKKSINKYLIGKENSYKEQSKRLPGKLAKIARTKYVSQETGKVMQSGDWSASKNWPGYLEMSKVTEAENRAYRMQQESFSKRKKK